MSELWRQSPALRGVVLVISAATVSWAAWSCLAPRSSHRQLGRLLEALGRLGARLPVLRRTGLRPAIARSLCLGGSPWLLQLADGDLALACRLLVGGRLLMLLAGCGAAAGLAALTPPIAPLALATALAAPLGLDLWLVLRGEQARRCLAGQLPLAVELLGVTLAAGVSLERALSRGAAEVDEPLRGVLVRAGARVATGIGAGAALREEAERTQVGGLTSLAAVLERGTTLGLPMGTPMHTLAMELRAAWRSALLARAGRATPIAALVTALVIAPACVGGLAVCLVSALLASGGLLA